MTNLPRAAIAALASAATTAAASLATDSVSANTSTFIRISTRLLLMRRLQLFLHRLWDWSNLPVVALARPRSVPTCPVRTRKLGSRLSALGQQCATLLRHNLPSQTLWCLLPSRLRELFHKRRSRQHAESGTPAFQPSRRIDPRPVS